VRIFVFFFLPVPMVLVTRRGCSPDPHNLSREPTKFLFGDSLFVAFTVFLKVFLPSCSRFFPLFTAYVGSSPPFCLCLITPHGETSMGLVAVYHPDVGNVPLLFPFVLSFRPKLIFLMIFLSPNSQIPHEGLGAKVHF